MKAASEYKVNLEVLPDLERLARRSVGLFVSDARKAIEDKGAFFVAISGGRTPTRFFELLGQNPEALEMPWNKIHLFWVDERYVPLDSKWSNYHLASSTFLEKVTIPEKNIHRIPTEYTDFQSAAREYEKTLKEIFNLEEGQLPEFDLIVLGMGEDGHVGSLFPNSYAHFDTTDLACVVYILEEELNRITLTHPVICAGTHVAVLVSGERKSAILKEVLTGELDEVRFPVHLLWPVLNKVSWLVDSQAAKLL
ncbi:MAG: 6-phosphogluconolactonase [Planctomycetota bacterium]|jgi:6-phosphogluconolactonase